MGMVSRTRKADAVLCHGNSRPRNVTPGSSRRFERIVSDPSVTLSSTERLNGPPREIVKFQVQDLWVKLKATASSGGASRWRKKGPPDVAIALLMSNVYASLRKFS